MSRNVLPIDRLVRFVAAPDGTIVPDLRRKLGGRGLWITGRREIVEQGIKSKVFQRGLRRCLKPTDALADQVDDRMHQQLCQALSMARKAGQVSYGWAKVQSLVQAGQAQILIQARDGAPNGRKKMVSLAIGQELSLVRLLGVNELSVALGSENVVHAAIVAGRFGKNWVGLAKKLDFFRGNNEMQSASELRNGWQE